ncbi:hypothetical protein [Rhodococcus sp. ADH]|uniref:hypothetical protein n=1 Tax=Rhodococcus sp. ADH TaxID=224843 RepID=UPI0012EE130C|nr:hypothetical protein [Rhodococcus sp. ADH]
MGSGDVAVTAAHPVGVGDLCAPVVREPHFDEFGGGGVGFPAQWWSGPVKRETSRWSRLKLS